MKKFLDILLIVMLTVLVMNLFSSKPQNILNETIEFSSLHDAYTIPASVWLNITNKTSETVIFDSCSDIQLKYAGSPIVLENPRVKTTEPFCREVTLKSWEKFFLDYVNYFEKFYSFWPYIFTLNLWEKEFISPFEIENPGTIRKLFTAIFYAPLYNLLVWLALSFWYSLGYAIIAITILIRLLLIYPQHRMMISQRKLQAVQPKIKEIQKKYKGQQQVLGMKLMELYKKEKVNPMWSLGFLLLQMPILIVIYNIILYIKDPSNYYYIYNFLNHFDLTKLSYDFYGVDLLGSWGLQWFILAISVAWIQFFQIKLSLLYKKDEQKSWVVLEKKKGESDYSSMMPDPNMMNKFMLYWMPAMVAVFTFFFIAWVWIYWGISTLFMIIQQLVVNKKSMKSS